MSTETKTNPETAKMGQNAHSIVWFEIPADNVERAKTFYGQLFGWKIEKFPGPMDYWHVDTGGSNDSPDGGLMKRQQPQQGITSYISVPSVDQFSAKVQKLGGKICMAKTAVPQMGYFAVCQDPENNTFAIWEMNESAK
ncbi:MAG TPA: VOC family protein [Verrucomicrobiae bacterium]|nr:VOC family protein [Verrucomicrobiae bacterium]